MKQKVSFDPDFPFQDVPLTEDNIQQQQSLLTWLRSYHIGDESGISLFDVLAAASITGFVYQRMEWGSWAQGAFLSLPMGIAVHKLFGIKTPLNKKLGI